MKTWAAHTARTHPHPLARCLGRITAAHLAATCSDRQLLARFAAHRDEAAFAALVRRHGPLVLGVCRRVLHDWHAAEDACQAVFVVLARRAGSLRRPAALGPWLHGVAVRTALKARAQAARRAACERQVAVRPVVEYADDLVWRELRPVLDEAVARLPEKYRVPFVLHYLEGRTVTEVAGLLGRPRGTVAVRLARAREQLRGRLARRGLAVSAAALTLALARAGASASAPAAWAASTAAAGAAVGAGKAAAGVVSAKVVVLTKGVLNAMFLTKLKVAAVVSLTLGAVGVGVGLTWHETRGEHGPRAGSGNALARYGDAPVSERFYAGGFRSSSGFTFPGVGLDSNGSRVGDDFLFLNSLEYQVPVKANDPFYRAAFVDSGTVEDRAEIKDYRVPAGVGQRLVVPMLGRVPVALDFGFPVVPGRGR
jgi:RNA polymerase sigma factor (sigma-70 family)